MNQPDKDECRFTNILDIFRANLWRRIVASGSRSSFERSLQIFVRIWPEIEEQGKRLLELSSKSSYRDELGEWGKCLMGSWALVNWTRGFNGLSLHCLFLRPD
ncbi:hypothetical protein Drorol1_Dr00004599 [Drosera rotundifolia]